MLYFIKKRFKRRWSLIFLSSFENACKIVLSPKLVSKLIMMLIDGFTLLYIAFGRKEYII